MPEQFDEHATDLDAWRADQDKLRTAEAEQHARIDRAIASPFGTPTPRPETFKPSPNAVALDKIQAVFTRKVKATNLEAILGGLNEIREILRSTGRKC